MTLRRSVAMRSMLPRRTPGFGRLAGWLLLTALGWLLVPSAAQAEDFDAALNARVDAVLERSLERASRRAFAALEAAQEAGWAAPRSTRSAAPARRTRLAATSFERGVMAQRFFQLRDQRTRLGGDRREPFGALDAAYGERPLEP